MKAKALIVLLLLLSCAAALEPLSEEPPPGVPADAEPAEEAVLDEAPETQAVDVDLILERAVPEQVEVGETFTVTLTVDSAHDGGLEILVVDPMRAGATYLDAPEPYVVQYEGLEVSLMRWTDTLQPMETREYTYRIRADSIGTITMPPASVNDQYGNTFESDPAFVEVVCKPDGVCGEGENVIHCPEDCPTGSADDVCDGAEDGRIDPDCLPEAEPDSTSDTTQPPPEEEDEESGICNLLLMPLLAFAVAGLSKTMHLMS